MKTLVILHGWGHDKAYWQDFIGKFQDTDVIAIDLPGFGEEPLVNSDWGIPEYALWVKNKIAEMKLDTVILLGHSFGGRIASFIASENPEWLKGLILYGSPSIYRPSDRTKLKIKVYKILKRLGLKNQKPKNTELQKADNDGLGKVFRNVVPFDQTELLIKINVPTLLIWGANDEAVPVTIAKELNILIPNSKLVILDGLGHNAHLENLNLFYGTVKNFI